MIRQHCSELNQAQGWNIHIAWKKAFRRGVSVVWSSEECMPHVWSCRGAGVLKITTWKLQKTNATVPQQQALISLQFKYMSTELDVLEQCSHRTGNRDRDRGIWVRSGVRSLFLVLKVIIVYSALTGLGVAREPIKTTCASVALLLKSCPWLTSCGALFAC